MAHSRAQSEALRLPHSISLKVLRLSRPALSSQFPLPQQPSLPSLQDNLKVDRRAALTYAASASTPQDETFNLTPLLTLPPGFGAVHVGETFSCALCINNELPVDDGTQPKVGGVRMTVEMQTPSQPNGIPLPTSSTAASPVPSSSPPPVDHGEDIPAGSTLQKNVYFDLREQGTHMLAVTVNYTETRMGGEGRAASGKGRSFRKIYQFVAQQLLSVRTKILPLPPRQSRSRYSLEAQLENLGDAALTLETVELAPRSPWLSHSLNWDMPDGDERYAQPPVLKPKAVWQVAFLLIEDEKSTSDAEAHPEDGKVILGQLSMRWKSSMGDGGALSTGWLGYKSK